VLEGAKEIHPLTDDAVHCRVGEPRNQPSTKWSSQKYGKKAALTYEVGIAIHHNQVVLINGPYPAAMHDMTMFNSPDGAGSKLQAGKKAIADRAYSGPQIAKRNEFDSAEVKMFKKRARARHETFNARIKSFNALDNFRSFLCSESASYHAAKFFSLANHFRLLRWKVPLQTNS
jgi:hypothetical protein